MNQKHLYRYRAVAFLDVLGFEKTLNKFELEAKRNKRKPKADDDFPGYYYSSSASKFISIFKNALEKLSVDKFKYYLFSDNICITSISETRTDDLKELLHTINELFYDFAQAGYFLRGGIDYGLFIDDDNLALGMPLANAYKLESTVAIYPRIVLSEELVNQFIISGDFEDDISSVLISQKHEHRYLNVFTHVFRSDYREDKEEFFKNLSRSIVHELEVNSANEKVFTKYKWLAEEFNAFIDAFVTNLAFQDSSLDPDQEPGFLDLISNQKINYA